MVNPIHGRSAQGRLISEREGGGGSADGGGGGRGSCDKMKMEHCHHCLALFLRRDLPSMSSKCICSYF